MPKFCALAVVAMMCVAEGVPAQAPEFEVVSIKKNNTGAIGGGVRTLPDGTTVVSNQPIRSVIARAADRTVRDIEGLPGWTMDRYDVIAKPPVDTKPDQLPAMWKRMLEDRMKLAVHVEPRDRDGFLLLLSRRDGRLGPALKPSSLDCPGGKDATGPLAKPGDWQNGCGAMMGWDRFASGGATMRTLAGMLASVLTAPVEDGTGLDGVYSVDFRFTRPQQLGQPIVAAAPDDAPDLFVAVQEQLGLKLQRRKVTVPVMVVDRVERPSEN